MRISVPVIFGQEPFYEFLSRILKKYPRLRVDLFITNQFIDLAIRFGELANSSIIAKRIGRSARYLVASARYLRGRAVEKPNDIANHQCVLLNGRNNETEWHLVSGRKPVKLRVSGPLSSRDFQTVSAFTYKGHGIGLLPSTYCDEGIKRRELVRLYPEWTLPEIFIHAVYPLPTKLQVFLDELKTWKSLLWLPLV